MNRTENKYVRDLFRVFVFLNRYPRAVSRHEVIFLLTVDLFESVNGLKAGIVTNFLKRGSSISQADKNKTWTAGRKLLKKGLLTSPKVGYYRTTRLGRERSRILLKELKLQDIEFDLSNY